MSQPVDNNGRGTAKALPEQNKDDELKTTRATIQKGSKGMDGQSSPMSDPV